MQVRNRRGFSLLEVTLALSIGGVMLGGLWQIMGATSQTRDSVALAGQANAVAAAAQQYISGQRTTLLALPGLASLNSVVRVKVTDTDTGDTANSVQGAGYLPSSFVNMNSFGQSFALYVRREDGGTMGSADASDRLVGLLITTGGSAIGDQTGARVAAAMGAPGGFLYADSNPANPTAATTAKGAYGAWQVDLTATGWSGIGATAQAGRFAVLTNMAPPSTAGSGGGGGGGAGSIDELSDGKTEYISKFNVFLGKDAGNSATGTVNTGTGFRALFTNSTGTANTGTGAYALNSNTTGQMNTANGTRALYANTTASNNSATGAYSLYQNTTGSRNTANGYASLYSNTTGSLNVAVGFNALVSATTADSNVGIGAYAMNSTTTGLQNTVVGYQAFETNTTGNSNVAVGYAALDGATTASYNTAVGSQALYSNSTGANNTTIGYQAGQNITTGTYNIVIGSGVNAPAATSAATINIGNLIYGDITNGRVGFASSSSISTSGISFDMGSRTDSARLAVGTTAQRPTCTASLEGAQRWNSQTQNIEVCTGGVWVQPTPAWTPVGNTPPTPPSGTGYIVLTNDSFDGNLGGIAGARTKCLNDLTTYDWMGKASAIARGILIAAKVDVMMVYLYGSNPWPANTTFYIAASGRPAAGGANITSTSNGGLPINAGGFPSFSGANYFDGVYQYWTSTYDALFNNSYRCIDWGNNTGSYYGGYAASTAMSYGSLGYDVCSASHRLVCVVSP